jgi:hypothetical protein
MKYSITIDNNLKIIKYKHNGTIKAVEIGAVWDKLLAMKEFTELKYNLFSDYRNAKFDIDTDFLPELMEFMFNIKDIVKGKKQCLIVDEPFTTAASFLFKNEVNEKVGFNVKVFSTEAVAMRWLTTDY